MSRQFDAKATTLRVYPDDKSMGVQFFLEYLESDEKEFTYSEGMTPEEYIYGKKRDSSRQTRIENAASRR